MRTIRRRRKEFKTNYGKRVKLLKGGKPRLVFRYSNSKILVQYTTSYEAQDKVMFGFDSRKLLEFGWPKEMIGSLRSMSASYLMGFFIGNEIKNKKLEVPIVDFGMTRIIYKNNVFGFLKGLIDSGINIECKKEAFPKEDRIVGKHMKKDFSSEFEKIKNNINKK